MKFRKKPVIIEAEQFKPEYDEYDNYVPVLGVYEDGPFRVNPLGKRKGTLYIDTLEGRHIVTPGDWIITGVKGEKYPCKPDIFEMTYEKIE